MKEFGFWALDRNSHPVRDVAAAQTQPKDKEPRLLTHPAEKPDLAAKPAQNPGAATESQQQELTNYPLESLAQTGISDATSKAWKGKEPVSPQHEVMQKISSEGCEQRNRRWRGLWPERGGKSSQQDAPGELMSTNTMNNVGQDAEQSSLGDLGHISFTKGT